jgi:hypothetical protein
LIVGPSAIFHGRMRSVESQNQGDPGRSVLRGLALCHFLNNLGLVSVRVECPDRGPGNSGGTRVSKGEFNVRAEDLSCTPTRKPSPTLAATINSTAARAHWRRCVVEFRSLGRRDCFPPQGHRAGATFSHDLHDSICGRDACRGENSS